jgi:hypothetical protein
MDGQDMARSKVDPPPPSPALQEAIKAAKEATRLQMRLLIKEMQRRNRPVVLPEDLPDLPGLVPGSNLPKMKVTVHYDASTDRWAWSILQPRPDLGDPDEPTVVLRYGCGGYRSEAAALAAREFQADALVAKGLGRKV